MSLVHVRQFGNPNIQPYRRTFVIRHAKKKYSIDKIRDIIEGLVFLEVPRFGVYSLGSLELVRGGEQYNFGS